MRKMLLMLILSQVWTCLIAQNRLDVTIDELLSLADLNSQQIRISMTGHESAIHDINAARSQRLPDVNISVSGSYIGTACVLSRGFSSNGTTTVPYTIGMGKVENGSQPTPHWGNDFVVQVTQLIYAGGGINAGILMAEQGEKMRLLDVKRNRQEVRFLIVGHYLELCKLINQLDVVRKNISLTEHVIKTMKARFQQGTVINNDITRYELQLKSLKLNETQILNSIKIINHQLVTTLHMPDNTEIHPMLPLQPIVQQTENIWQQTAARENVSLQQAQLAADISETKVKITHSAQLPTVALIAESRLTGPYVNDLIPVDANISTWFIGVGIRYDIGNLWRKAHDVRKARVNVRQSREQIVQQCEIINNAVQTNYINLQTSYVEVETQQKQVELANEHYQITQNRYENGLALLTDMLDASSMKLSADIELVNAQINLIYNYYKLKYITSTL